LVLTDARGRTLRALATHGLLAVRPEGQ
jgi:hypothetical protein